jgi:hypothetical protein
LCNSPFAIQLTVAAKNPATPSLPNAKVKVAAFTFFFSAGPTSGTDGEQITPTKQAQQHQNRHHHWYHYRLHHHYHHQNYSLLVLA